ncbi:MAG: hypothetical protein ACI8UO_005745, partial [Verrucomicrobiales bacterium]
DQKGAGSDFWLTLLGPEVKSLDERTRGLRFRTS